MNHLIKCPDWAFKMFANLCYSQVKEQLPENILLVHTNPPSFVCNGHLYAFTHNRSLIAGEKATGYASSHN